MEECKLQPIGDDFLEKWEKKLEKFDLIFQIEQTINYKIVEISYIKKDKFKMMTIVNSRFKKNVFSSFLEKKTWNKQNYTQLMIDCKKPEEHIDKIYELYKKWFMEDYSAEQMEELFEYLYKKGKRG